jgi:cobaltochelatase CobS
MSNYLKRREWRAKVLETLKPDKWIETVALMQLLGVDPFDQGQCTPFRKLLYELEREKLVLKMGSGKYRWRLASGEPEKKTGMVGKFDGDVIQITGQTFNYKEQLKALGCEWDEEGRLWRAHRTDLIKFEKLLDNFMALDLLNQQQRDKPKSKPEPPAKPESNGVDFGPLVESLKKKLDDLEDQVAALNRAKKVEITIRHKDGSVVKPKGKVHPIFEQVMFHVNAGDNVMLVGPKGCGKTMLAEHISQALKRPHGMISLSGGVTESKLFGRVVPNVNTGKNEYHSTQFVELYENGGVFLLDEVDAADPNVLLSINGALTIGKLPLDRTKKPMAKRHDDFVCIAAANTWGSGADRQYVGRNQQDSAFTERFVQLEMDYDRDLEFAICPGAEDLVKHLHKIRDAVVANKLERTVSTRFIARAYNWIQYKKPIEYVEQMLFAGWRADEIRKVKG